ncbi:MAG TPA: M14 family zinc carboxypeptidase [Vicinamibacteria bacterium]
MNVLLFLLAAGLPAVQAAYDPAVPTPESVLRYSLGSRVTDYAGMERYVSVLAEASPRVITGTYGTDYEGRELRYLVLSSSENIGRLDTIRSWNARLVDPRALAASEVASFVEQIPLTLWLNYSTDGNETAGLESALMMAYHLAAATDSATLQLLDDAVIVMTPVMNPSSHERWASWSNSFAAGPAGNSDPLAMEHNPPWGILTNNNRYLVDLNRESVWSTQRESAALRKFYYEWNPSIFIDLHGEYDNFVGPGYREPLNPLYTDPQRRWLDRFGEAIGRKFGGFGWSYSPWEAGTFYPGFWESFGLLNGAIGFTFETMGGGSKGLRYRREDGSVITLKLAAEQHLQASLAVLETAAAARVELLDDFAAFWRSALTLEDRVPEKAFFLEPGADPGRVRLLIETLLANRVEVYQTAEQRAFEGVTDYFGRRWNERSFPAGTYVVPVGQAQARLVLTLLRKELELPAVTQQDALSFRQNQEKPGFRNEKIESTTYLFYDVTAWSMPLTFGVPAYWTETSIPSNLTRIDSTAPEVIPPVPAAAYGYVFSGARNTSMALLLDLLGRGIVTNVAYGGFRIAGKEFPRGSLLIRNERNPGVDLEPILSEASARHGVPIEPLDTSYSEEGPRFGSDQFVFVEPPRVAVLVGDPVNERSFGDAWFVLEQIYGFPFTAIYRGQLTAEHLDDYKVLVLPDGDYLDAAIPKEWVETIKSWLQRGGTLVCLKNASAWASHPDVDLTANRMRRRMWPLDDEEREEQRPTASIPGAILRSLPDEHHYLTFGYDGPTPVLVHSNLAFEPNASLAAPFSLAESARDLLLAGFAYPDSLERLADTPYVVEERLGSGRIVLFLDDPNFRVYWHGLARVFLNSILLSPSF